MDFWGGMEHPFVMSSTTGEERATIWDTVAGYIQERLLLHKGTRIPTLGSFYTVPKWIQVGDKAITVQRPMFHLARNLVADNNLTDNKDYLPGHKELEPLKYSKVATVACVSRQKVENCIQGTISFLSVCLRKGKNIALVLRDLGVLLIEGTKVQMKFFHNFLERMSGKENWDKAVAKVPQLLDMAVSSDVPLGSLTFSGHVIAFPEFSRQFVAKPLARDRLKHWRGVPGEKNWEQRRILRPLMQDTKGAFAELPSPAASRLSLTEMPEFHKKDSTVMQEKSPVSREPVIPEDSTGKTSTGKKLVVTSRLKGKPTQGSQVAKQSQMQVGKPQSCRGGGQGEKKVHVRHKLLSTSSEARMPNEEPTRKFFIPQPTGAVRVELLKSRPEVFWSTLKEPQKAILAGYSFQPSLLLPPGHKESRSIHLSLQTTPMVSMIEWP